MSGSIKLAKAYYRGDPGIFDSIWKGVKGAVGGFISGGPLGAIGGAAKGIGLIKAPAPAINVASVTPFASNGKPLNPSLFPVLRTLPQLPVQVDSTRTSGVSLFPGGPMVGTQTTYSSPASMHPGAGCGSGFHLNKTGYYTRQGFIQAGSRCVRNRKRNPLNPRAASRAMSRLSSAKKAVKSLNRISIREAGCGCK